MTKEEKDHLDGMRAMKADIERQIAECEEIATQIPDNRENQDRLATLRSLREKATAYLRDGPPRVFRLP